MMSYSLIKTLHILSMVLLFGTGLGSAFYKWMADRSRVIAHIAVTNKHVVLADWIFTTPCVIFQPVSGLLMVHIAGWSITEPWIITSLSLYILAGLCWLPVVYLQIRMQKISELALKESTNLSPDYWHLAKMWFWLGVPAFASMVMVVALMVFKHLPGVA
ncbi:DUF2269 family protein [Undibacterium sp. Dicai25W]|uniref:DUF2269 family protein n=1 Tax=Undibacterium sp. Dicai25W TaxID=3413034 RepID=UPI003BF439EF